MTRRKSTPEPRACIVIETPLSPAEIVAALGLITGDGVPYWTHEFSKRRRVYYVDIFKGEMTEERLRIRRLTEYHYLFPMVSARISVVNDSTHITFACVEQNYLTQVRWIVMASSVPIYVLYAVAYAVGWIAYPPSTPALLWTLFFILFPVGMILALQLGANQRLKWVAKYLKRILVPEIDHSKRWAIQEILAVNFGGGARNAPLKRRP